MPAPKKQPRPIKYKVEAGLVASIADDHRGVALGNRIAEKNRAKRDAGILKLAARGWTPGDIERATGVPAGRVRDLRKKAVA